ncbi:sphingomyelin phosphodiesterase-like [Toxorhynchites rutilus septentrionalis]|uniref:sphingomyelin phosphodiesterase-like n=1 Tax=Toxorhynchites rutilus septentrionalis TaxID=329112 RepID=UPI0024783901|nr:sphingomyelin phosphodiesterase-like [Toxorhynchites rutilus septentrionalis]
MGLVVKALLLAGVLVATACAYQVKPSGYNYTVQLLQRDYERLEKEFRTEFQIWRKYGLKTSRFIEMVDNWKLSKDERRSELQDLPVVAEGQFCSLCRAVIPQLVDLRKFGASREDLFDAIYELCTLLEIQEPDVCYGLIDSNLDFFLYIIDTRPTLKSESICGVVFQSDACVLNDPEFTEWTVNVDAGGKPITESKHFPHGRGPNDIKIVQITDFHYDPKYKIDHNAVCNRPACCRNDQGIPEDPANRAGRWGDYRDCDSPWEAVEDVIDHVVEHHSDAAYIYHTGDIIDHGIWETSVGHNIGSMNRVYMKLLDVFPNTPVYNIIGNHEAHPTNVFMPNIANRSDFSMDWLYHYSADVWGNWLPRSTRNTIEQGGYYTALVRPGFRIVGLNNQDCYTYNWWILWEPSFLSTQLQWLHDVLLHAERNGEKVHILAHIPYSSSGSTFRTCQREFRRIVERFHNTISAQFNGHTHRDEFNVFYSRENPAHAINVAWNGGSATAFTFINPNYVVYYVDPETYQVTDFESFSYNLTDANRFPDRRPEWYKLYSFAEEFKMHNLSPAQADKLVKRMGTPEGRDELRRYWEYKVKLGDPSLAAGCDEHCLLNHLCEVVVSEMGDDVKCDELAATFFYS